MELVTAAAIRNGFTGGLVVDFPESTKAKKYFLCLFAGNPPEGYSVPKGLDGTETTEESKEEREGVSFADRSHKKHKQHKKKDAVKSKSWILKKKETQRKKGLEVRPDTKYTGKKRSGPRF
jgi:18S rRNA (guanine1575-N7)-methyltransferase